MFRRSIFFLLFILLTVSCAREEYTDKSINEIVQKTDSLLVNLSGQKYDWASAKAFSKIRAYYPEPDIIFLNENLTYRKPADAFNLYYYKNGKLIHFIGKKLEYINKNEKNVKKQLTKLTLNLESDGDIISYNKTVNGKLTSLDDSDLEEVLTHAAELYKIVGDGEE